MVSTPSISVLLSGMSRILGDILRSALADTPSVDVVGGPIDVHATLESARTLRPSVVICGTAPEAAQGLYEALLNADPALRIVEIGEDGRHARLHERVPPVAELGDISLTRLVATVRGQ
jgi:hypothetical protein